MNLVPKSIDETVGQPLNESFNDFTLTKSLTKVLIEDVGIGEWDR